MKTPAAAVAMMLVAGCGPAPRARREVPPSGAPAVVRAAFSQIGRPYRFGGASPERGFDCSGLAWWSFRESGLQIPRTSVTQFAAGRKVPPSKARPGDLVFFTTYKKGPSHVGIFVGDGTFVHAPSNGKPVTRTPLANPYWKKRFLGVRRFLN